VRPPQRGLDATPDRRAAARAPPCRACEGENAGKLTATPKAASHDMASGTFLALSRECTHEPTNGCRVRRSRHHVCSGGPAKEPNSNRIGTRCRAGGLDALRAAPANRRTLARGSRNPNRRTRGMRPALGKARKDRSGTARRSCHDTGRRPAGPLPLGRGVLAGSLQSGMNADQPSGHRLWLPSAPGASLAGHFPLRRADEMRLVVTHGTVR
jgi:hypothetical protein